MRFLFCFIAFFAIVNSVEGQTIHGRIVNDDDAVPLAGVVIQNLSNNSYNAISDDEGQYSVSAQKGDSIKFALLGFSPRIVVFSGENEGWFSWIGMKSQSYVIDTIVVRRELTEYQKDSLENREIYGKKVDYRPAKPQLPKLKDLKAGKPFVITAPISGFIEKRQKKYKRLKAFQKRYVETEAQHFIDSRYVPTLVTELTRLHGDTLTAFIQAYPMPYSFARTASDLEIKMWIKYNYREWIKKPVLIPPTISKPNLDTNTLRKP
jgi:hypothetical protein